MRLTTLRKQGQAHEEGVWSCAWVPGSDQLLTGSLDETVKVWEDEADSLSMGHTYTGHTLGVVSVVTDATGAYAASSSLDSLIRVWSMRTHETKAIIETAPMETWAVAFSPRSDGMTQLATAGGSRNAVIIWNIGEEQTSFGAELALPQATGSEAPQAAAGGKAANRERFVLSVAYSPDGSRVACGAMDGTVAVYDVASNSLIGTLKGHRQPVRSLTFTPDSRLLLSACDDRHVNMYDAGNAQLVDAFSGHDSWVLSVAAHPSGTCFASSSSDGKAS